MEKTAVSYSKLNPVKNGVLVCVDEKKAIFKYIPLGDVVINAKRLEDVLKEKDDQIENLAKSIVKLEQKLGISSALLTDLAATEGDDF